MQQTLYLMVGYPGSGKTTASRIIHDQTGAVHLWADDERKKLFVEPTYSHEENLKLYSHLNDVAEALLANGKSVIFDTNFNFYRDRQHLREVAARQHAKTVIIWVVVPQVLAQQRAVHESHGKETRVFGNMPLDHFERIARNLETPQSEQHVVKVDGTNVTPESIADALQQT